MSGHDPELEAIRAGVNCAVVLEQASPPWQLDRRQSTPRCRKYRRGAGEILIVNHGGLGWWEPLGEARGDVFDLVQYLEPGLNFGEVRRVLRPFIGLAPNPSCFERTGTTTIPDRTVAERWLERPRLREGFRSWRYLHHERAIPGRVLAIAWKADAVREGPYGSAWFAHRDHAGQVSHVEIRGPDFKGSLGGGVKRLFRLWPGQGHAPLMRLVLAEAPIDAMSVLALETIRLDTIYAATGGGMGPSTLAAIEEILTLGPDGARPRLVSAADNNPAGHNFAERHRAIAASLGAPFERLLPPVADGDWNDALKQGRGRL